MERRHRILKEGRERRGPVAYWMSRDQRAQDNWALLYAQQLARERRVPLLVGFCLVPRFLGAAWRHYDFLLRGLEEVAGELERHRIGFCLLTGDPGVEIPKWVTDREISLLVSDFDPLRIKRTWKEEVARKLTIPFLEVDAHNIVPCWLASPKQEWAAATFRPRLRRHLEEFLHPFPPLQVHPVPPPEPPGLWDSEALLNSLPLDREVPPVAWLKPGTKAALTQLRLFVREKLAFYPQSRNDPTREGQSDLSPYLHFGQLAPQRVALEVLESPAPRAAKEAFLEQLIVRRELADNFCYYQPDYDRLEGFPAWARLTLEAHRQDPRDYLYTPSELERGQTHDPLWNAAQWEMVRRGKMHGYLRMYWAKKILEWTPSPEEALAVAIRLNDRYELDGRDPNGYTGIAWSIGGVHDRPFGERPVIGKLRPMSWAGLARKFRVREYIERQEKLWQEENSQG